MLVRGNSGRGKNFRNRNGGRAKWLQSGREVAARRVGDEATRVAIVRVLPVYEVSMRCIDHSRLYSHHDTAACRVLCPPLL